jgi:hypothetical protein
VTRRKAAGGACEQLDFDDDFGGSVAGDDDVHDVVAVVEPN